MTDLRTAAQQALEAMSSFESGTGGLYEGEFSAEIAALRAALAEPEDWELRRLREELERCKQTCAATSEAWREEAALAEPVQEPVAAELRRLHEENDALRQERDEARRTVREAHELGTAVTSQRDALLEALHNISLAAQDSGSTREGMGLYARAAIKQAEEKV